SDRVIYRSYSGLHMRDVKTGEIEVEAPSTWALERMLRNNQHVGTVLGWVEAFIGKKTWPNVLSENTTVNSLSTDGTYIYGVDAFPVPPHWSKPPFRLGSFDQKLNDALSYNRLQTYEVESGKLRWEVGGVGSTTDDDLLDTYFLGPPLPLNGKLLVLAEKKQELHLVTLTPDT